jgi:hypothetical protein
MAIQQGDIWMAFIGKFLVAMLGWVFVAGITAAILFGLTRWWKR